jgi:hypothetical protein
VICSTKLGHDKKQTNKLKPNKCNLYIIDSIPWEAFDFSNLTFWQHNVNYIEECKHSVCTCGSLVLNGEVVSHVQRIQILL